MSTTNILDLNNRIDALEKIAHDVEPIQQQIDELKAWTDSGTKDASGNPIILTDGAELEPTALTVTLEESEDGYSSCTVSRDSKNLIPLELADIKRANTRGTWSGNTLTISDVTFTILTDSNDNVTGIKVNGTASETIVFSVCSYTAFNGTFVLNGCPSGGGNEAFRLDWRNNLDGVLAVDTGSGVDAVAMLGREYYIAIRIQNRYNMQNKVFTPMLRLSSVSDATFEPYLHDTASISFGETINAGSVDFITGIVNVTEPEAKTLTLTPDNITLLNGYNVISSAGNIALSYHPDNLYSAELVMNNMIKAQNTRIAAQEEKIALLAGGDTGQVLTKVSDNDYDVSWETLPATRTTTKKSEK